MSFEIYNNVLLNYNAEPNETKLAIPDGVTEIGNSAFYYCEGPKEIILPDSVTKIGSLAFAGCSALKKIRIPEGVTEIGNSAFFECSKLAEIVLPQGIQKLNDMVFHSCRGLKTVIIPDSVTVIESAAFCDCKKLKTVILPRSLQEIGSSAFSGCKELEDISIPESVTEIGVYAFNDCSSLTTIHIPDGVSVIKAGTFFNCKKLAEAPLPGSLKSIERKAFYNCSIQKVLVPEGVTQLGEGVFDGCPIKEMSLPASMGKLTQKELFIDPELIYVPNIDILPESLRPAAIRSYLHDGAKADDPRAENHLKYLKKNAVKLLSNKQFSWYKIQPQELIPLLVREKLMTAKDEEFFTTTVQETQNAELIAMVLNYFSHDVTEKQKGRVKASKEKADDEVFTRMAARQEKTDISGLRLAFSGDFQAFRNRTEIKAFLEENGAKLATSITSKVDYLVTNETSKSDNQKKAEELGIEIITERHMFEIAGKRFTIKNGVLARYNGEEKNVIIPDGITKIGYGAFTDYDELESVTIPDCVQSASSPCFAGISDRPVKVYVASLAAYLKLDLGSAHLLYVNNELIDEVNLYGSGAAVPAHAFSGCRSIKSVSLAEGITSIESSAFANCRNLEKLNIPQSLVKIGVSAFEGCGQLESIEIPQNVVNIGPSAFKGCRLLKSITIPDDIHELQVGLFSDCSSLEAVTIPEQITSIGAYAFSGCTGLKELAIPENVTSIGNHAFYGCTGLKELTISENVTSIGNDAFYGCTGLKELTIPGNVTSIGNDAFRGCTGLKELTISENVTSIGNDAFYGCTGLKELTIPENVTSIGWGAFERCTGLEKLELSDKVAKIGISAFSQCPGLTIYAPQGSYAAQYADEEKIPCVKI